MQLNEYKEYVMQSYAQMSYVYEAFKWAYEKIDEARREQGLYSGFSSYTLNALMAEYVSAIEYQNQIESFLSEKRAQLAASLSSFVGLVTSPKNLEGLEFSVEDRAKLEKLFSKETVEPIVQGLGYEIIDQQVVGQDLMQYMLDNEMVDCRMANGVLWVKEAASFKLYHLGLMDRVEGYHQKAIYETSKEPIEKASEEDDEPNQ